MSFVRLVCGRVFRLLLSLLSPFRRLLCFAQRGVQIGELPFVVKVEARHGSQSDAPALDGWQSADWDKQQLMEQRIEEFRMKQQTEKSSPSDAVEPDFFSDMKPEVNRTKKALLGRKQQLGNGFQKSSLFQLTDESPHLAPVDKLGELDETEPAAAWDDDLQGALEEHRAEIREKRLAEHARRNREKLKIPAK